MYEIPQGDDGGVWWWWHVTTHLDPTSLDIHHITTTQRDDSGTQGTHQMDHCGQLESSVGCSCHQLLLPQCPASQIM
jgi:hypothetical protein